MVVVPKQSDCEVEILMVYELEPGNTLHSVGFYENSEILCVGTGTGQLLNFNIKIGPNLINKSIEKKVGGKNV